MDENVILVGLIFIAVLKLAMWLLEQVTSWLAPLMVVFS
jgi:hypothetical protein